jgi:hypothetical protein
MKEGGLMPTVHLAKVLYVSGCLGSLQRSSDVLLQQYNFPYKYEERDCLISDYSDRMISREFERMTALIKEFTGSGDQRLPQWAMGAMPEKVMEFLKNAFQREVPNKPGVPIWTGFRVMGHVNVGNGYNLCTFELFGKHVESKTTVYSGEDAPNIIRSRSQCVYMP